MNRTFIHPVKFATLAVFLFTLVSFSQEHPTADPLEPDLKNIARQIMQTGSCILITQDKEGRSRARIMDPFEPEPDFTIWFGTNPKSRKVMQIKNDPGVTLCYTDTDGSGYVVINGKAELIDDPEEKNRRWKEQWNAFYPNRDTAYLLIRVIPEWLEVVSNSRGITGDPETWTPQKIVFK